MQIRSGIIGGRSITPRKLMRLIWPFCLLLHGGPVTAAEITHEKFEDRGVISIEGKIEPSDLDKFRQISIIYDKAIVVLSSGGGALLPAIEIGKIIKIAGFTTLVPPDAVCASSCALIWLAGETRLLSPAGRVGFHASYRDNNGRLEESGVANALIGNYLSRLNLPERAIVFATQASPNEILWLSKTNKAEAGIDFQDFGSIHGEAVKPVSEPSNSPPPIYISPSKPTSGLPPSLPTSLSQSSSEWIKFAGNAFYDANSVRLVKDINMQSAGRKFWVVIDHGKDPKSKVVYSLAQYFVYCPNETTSIYYWADYLKGGKKKVKEVSSGSMPASPGSAEMRLINALCK